MQLNREKIQRMFTGSQANGGGGGGGDTEGLASELWVEQNYLSKEFFLRLFNIHGEDENDDPVDVQPNDLETTITDIEAMFGFWTEQYLSALGQNSEQGGGGITLNAALASINNSPLGNPTGTSTVLMFNGTTWVYASMCSTDMSTVWTALAAATNQQINISHLTTALSGYATTSQLSDYATVTDLEQLASYFNTLSGYFTNGAANEAVKLETARTIWGQQFDGTANITGDITQATCLEFSGIAGTATNGGFIDFHYAGGGADYTSRIIEDVSGVLKINNTIWAQLSGNVSIGTSTISQTYKLDVSGYTKTTRLYLADGVYLEYDSTNSGVHLVGAGFYSDSYVSALGVNSGGGGGGSDYIPLTGSSSITGTLAPSVATADLGSSTNKWRNIYGTSLSISNTLTTYALTVNSSATVVGSITATNGNLVASTGYVSSAGGYKVTGKDDTSVLLAGGGTKPLSEIGSAYTLPAATAAALGGLKVTQSYGTEAIFEQSGNIQGRNYGLEIDSNQKAFVYVPWEDTKNTAGATNNGSTKLFLIGATTQSNNPQTYSNSNCYIGTDNCLYSNGVKVLTSDGNVASATKLQTARSIWGRSFDGTADIGIGDFAKMPYVVFKNYNDDGNAGYCGRGGSSSNGLQFSCYSSANVIIENTAGYIILNSSGNVGIGDNTPSNKLTVVGAVKATQFIRTGGTSSQFLKADGSVDSNTYLTSADDTKNTAGNYMTSSKIWLVGTLASSTVQSSYAVTYTNVNCYINGSTLYSNNEAVLTSSTETKNTAGNFNVGASGGALNRIYLTGTASYSNAQDSYQVTSVNSYCYIGTDNCLYSNGTKVATTSDLSAYVVTSTLNNYLALSGGTMTGANPITFTINKIQMVFRAEDDGGYASKLQYMSNGNEALVFANGKAATSFIFKCGCLLTDGNNWSDSVIGTPTVQIKEQSLYVNTYLASNSTPSYNFYVTGSARITSNIDAYVLKFDKYQSQNYGGYVGRGSSNDGHIDLVAGTGAMLRIGANYDYGMYFDTSNNVGIGTSVPTQKLEVNGNIKATHVYDGNGNEYLTSGDVVTVVGAQNITGAKTFTATLTSSAGGSFTGGLKFYSLCVECASDGTPSSSRYGEINRYNGTLHLQYDTASDVTMCQEGFTFRNSGRTGGTRSIIVNSTLQLTCGSGTPYTDKNWVYNSDMRKKDVIRLIDMDAQRIADAPIFDFTWKSDAVKELTLGSSAQYWQKVLPNAVRRTPDGYLGMDYCSIALAAAVITARKVVDHEARIRLLEVENAALRNEINQLKKVA